MAVESDKPFTFAGFAPKADKPVCQNPASKIRLHFLKDVKWKRELLGSWLCRCYKGFKIFLDRSVQNRLFGFVTGITQLVDGGFLTKTRFALPLKTTNDILVSVVYQIARLGLKTLAQVFPDEAVREEELRLNGHSIRHDLILNDALLALARRFPDTKTVNGRLRENGRNHSGKRNPDALILDSTGKPGVAIELELTAKSKKCYRDIILQYRLNPIYPTVLYIVSGNVIREKISYETTNQKKIPGLSNPSTGKFYFVSLSDLLKDPTATSISNGATELLLANSNGQLARIGVQ